MAVVIEELDVQTQPPPAAPAPVDAVASASAELDAAALQAALQREAWRLERLMAD